MKKWKSGLRRSASPRPSGRAVFRLARSLRLLIRFRPLRVAALRAAEAAEGLLAEAAEAAVAAGADIPKKSNAVAGIYFAFVGVALFYFGNI